jgi:hypothetical protein
MKVSSAFLAACSWFALTGTAAAAGSVDAGRAWFNSVCFACHFEPATAPRFVPARFSPAYLTSAFQRTPAMVGNLALLNAQAINDIATYLGLVGLGLPNANDADRLVDWAEDTFPQLLSPARQPTLQLSGYSYRFYPASGIYLATKDGSVWFYSSGAPAAALQNLGPLRSYLDLMPNGR